MLNAYYDGQTDIVLADDHNEENTADYDQMKNMNKNQKKNETGSGEQTSENTDNTSETEKSVVYDLQGGFSHKLSKIKFENRKVERIFLCFVYFLSIFSRGITEYDRCGIPVFVKHTSSTTKVHPVLSAMINYCTSVRFPGFEESWKKNKCYQMSSFSETQGLSHLGSRSQELVLYNARQLSRIYPKGQRIDSSNYNPTDRAPINKTRS